MPLQKPEVVQAASELKNTAADREISNTLGWYFHVMEELTG